MRVAGDLFDSRVGRRAFALFCVAALLPVAVLWFMTQRALERDLAEADRAQRHALAKSYGLAVFERLDTAARIVDRLPDAPADLDALAPLFQSVHRLDQSDEPRAIGLRAAADRAGPSVRLLVVPVPGNAPPGIVLLRHGLAAHGGAARIAAVLSPDYVWGRTDELPAGVLVCVSDAAGRPLFCPGGPVAGPVAEPWSLFLNAAFGSEPWSFVVVPDPGTARRADSELPQAFGLVAAGTVLLVALLSLVQIRRTLGPLSRLVEKTREVAAGDYRPLALPRGDEFGVLGAAFDEMGARIDGQLATLRALAEIDRRILAALDLDGIVALVLERARQVEPGVAMAVAHLRAPEAGLLDVHAQGDGGDPVHRRLPCDARLLRRLARDDAPGDWREPAEDDPWRQLLAAAGIEAQRVLPLAVRGRPVGAVALGPGAASSPRLAELRDLGERVAVAVAAKERDDLLVFQARHDALTGLPNRYDAIETLNAALRRAAAGDQARIAVLFIDLDRFKAINDGLGHAVGDAVLSEMARQIAGALPPGGYLARWGGDEFIALVDPAGEPAEVGAAANALIDALSRPIQVGATELELRCSVGIAIHPGDGDSAEALLRNADIAMYRAKQAGRGRCVFFEERMNVEAAARIRLQADLRAAIRDRGLHLEFQPRVDSRDGRIVAAEALARWVHPEEGPVPPTLFVRLAEEAGLIEDLGAWAIEEACRAFAGWRAAGAGLRCVSVNVSSRQLRGDALVRDVREAMARHGLRQGELEIEITESTLARDLAEAATQLEALRALGATVAVDDFGTGYSSLAYLRRLPVDTIKIDRGFIVDMVESHAALALVRAIVAMGEALGKQLVAEGVENDEQVAVLRSWGCHLVQGNALYPPIGARRLLDELLAP